MQTSQTLDDQLTRNAHRVLKILRPSCFLQSPLFLPVLIVLIEVRDIFFSSYFQDQYS